MKIFALNWILVICFLSLPGLSVLNAQVDSTEQIEKEKTTALGRAEREQARADREEARKRRIEAQLAIKENVRELRTKMDEIRAAYRNGEINEKEMEEQMQEASEEMADNMEKLAKELEENIRIEVDRKSEVRGRVEAPPSPPAQGSIPGITIEKDEETGQNKVKVKVKGKPKAPRRTNTGFNIAFGRNTMFLESDQQEGVVYPEMEFWKGRYSEWGIVAHTRIGAARSPLYLNYGLSLVYNKTNMSGNNMLTLVNGAPSFQNLESATLTKARLENHYLNGQIGFRIAPRRNNHFHIEVNAFAGARFRSKQVLEYTNTLNEEVKESRKHNYNTNPFNYGVSAAIGYNWISLYARYEMSSLFKNNSVYDYRPFSAGIRFNLI
jgi:hypothetical protein